MVGAFVLPRGSVGMTDASTTRSPSTPRTLSSGSTTLACLLASCFESPPMAQVPAGWYVVTTDARMKSRISWSVCTPSPGASSSVQIFDSGAAVP